MIACWIDTDLCASTHFFIFNFFVFLFFHFRTLSSNVEFFMAFAGDGGEEKCSVQWCGNLYDSGSFCCARAALKYKSCVDGATEALQGPSITTASTILWPRSRCPVLILWFYQFWYVFMIGIPKFLGRNCTRLWGKHIAEILFNHTVVGGFRSHTCKVPSKDEPYDDLWSS